MFSLRDSYMDRSFIDRNMQRKGLDKSRQMGLVQVANLFGMEELG